MGFISIQMDRGMKASYRTEKDSGMAKFTIPMGIFMTGNGKITKKMVMVCRCTQQARNIKENGKKMSDQERENSTIIKR